MKRIRMKPPVVTRGKRVRGQIIYVDRFGNLISNIDEDCIRKAFPRRQKEDLVITCAAHRICGLSECYSETQPGMAIALFGSYNVMELAVRDGNASSLLGVGTGDAIAIESSGKRIR